MTRIALCALFCCAVVASASGNLVDWSDVTWTPDDLGPNSFTGGDAGATTVTLEFSDPDNILTGAGTDPFDSPFISSGTSGFDDSLQFRFNDNSASGVTSSNYSFVTLTITFDQPVNNVRFAFGDIDGGSAPDNAAIDSWQDIVVVTGSLLGSEVGFSASGLGSSVGDDSADGNLFSTGSNVTLYGLDGDTPSTGSDATDGNATLTADDIIDTIVIEYRPGKNNDGLPFTGPDNPTSQFIRLHDIHFTAIPEPSAFLLMGALTVLCSGSVLRKRK